MNHPELALKENLANDYAESREISSSITILFAFWLVLSGKLELKYLIFGLASAAMVTFVTQDLLEPQEGQRKTPSSMTAFLKAGWRLFSYFVWLVCEIVQSNLQVAYIVLHPKLPIEPGLLRFRTRLRSQVGHVILYTLCLHKAALLPARNCLLAQLLCQEERPLSAALVRNSG